MSSLGKNNTKMILLVVFVSIAGVGGYLLGVYFPYTNNQDQTDTITLKIGGSSTVTPLVNASLTKFHEFYPNLIITLEMTDSGTGVTKTKDGTYDIGMSSKSWGANGASDNLYCWKVARDGICMIVNIPSVTGLNLTKAEINGIYNGSITNWNQLNGNNGHTGLPDHAITAVIREAGSGTRDYFESWVNGSAAGAYHPGALGGTIVTQNENPLVQSAVLSTPYSIGYVGIAFTTGAILCNVSGYNGLTGVNTGSFIEPTIASVNALTNTYPISRNLWLMTNTHPAAGTAAFKYLEFMFSFYGSAAILAGGGVPLNPLHSSITAEDHWGQGLV